MPATAKRSRFIGPLIVRLLLLLPIIWAGAALWIDGPQPRVLAVLLAAIFLFSSLGAVLVMSVGRAFLLVTAGVIAVAIWWSMIPPRNDRTWLADVACPPLADRRGDLVTLYNVRDFVWRSDTDFDVRWETRTFDLSQITGLDLFISQWGPTEIAHTIMSWEFADGRHLAISIETRKEQGEEYSALKGFFRQYELYYAVAEERDIIGVRTDCRGENVHLYRLRTPADRARRLFIDYLASINQLATHPAWYNALTENCTTTIFWHVKALTGRIPFNWRILANGYLDEMLYGMGVLDTSMPLAELRERSDITEASKAAGDADDYSSLIRANLPPRQPQRAAPP